MRLTYSHPCTYIAFCPRHCVTRYHWRYSGARAEIREILLLFRRYFEISTADKTIKIYLCRTPTIHYTLGCVARGYLIISPRSPIIHPRVSKRRPTTDLISDTEHFFLVFLFSCAYCACERVFAAYTARPHRVMLANKFNSERARTFLKNIHLPANVVPGKTNARPSGTRRSYFSYHRSATWNRKCHLLLLCSVSIVLEIRCDRWR